MHLQPLDLAVMVATPQAMLFFDSAKYLKKYQGSINLIYLGITFNGGKQELTKA